MAIAFYIPDQATLLRKSSEKEQQILRNRETHWRFLACVLLDALRQYVESTPHYLLTADTCRAARKSGKQRKTSN